MTVIKLVFVLINAVGMRTVAFGAFVRACESDDSAKQQQHKTQPRALA